MTKQQKITLSASRDIPFNKLMLSQSNVRHVKAGVSIEELAEDIARRTLLSSITVRPVLDDSGAETGMYTIPAGGRRFRALELLVKQKRMNKTALVPCIVRTDGLAEEDSLAENVQRAPLHPLDQFRAFQTMREKGRTEEEIAAAFFVSASVVKQRLKLAAALGHFPHETAGPADPEPDRPPPDRRIAQHQPQAPPSVHARRVSGPWAPRLLRVPARLHGGLRPQGLPDRPNAEPDRKGLWPEQCHPGQLPCPRRLRDQ
jgi:ParB/RepB/Spo0J family partition protein